MTRHKYGSKKNCIQQEEKYTPILSPVQFNTSKMNGHEKVCLVLSPMFVSLILFYQRKNYLESRVVNDEEAHGFILICIIKGLSHTILSF